MRWLPGLAALLPLLLLGCDEANQPDIPAAPYTLAAVREMPGVITDVDADGDFVGVALEYVGFDVLNAADLHAITLVDTYRVRTLGTRCRGVAVNARNHTAGGILPEDAAAAHPIRDLLQHRLIGVMATTGAVETAFRGNADTLTIWITNPDTDHKFQGEQWYRRAADSAWAIDMQFHAPDWVAPYWRDAQTDVERFGISDAGIAAIAWQAGVTFYDCRAGTVLDTIYLPGRAYDCAWRGNDVVVVAAEFSVQLVRWDAAGGASLITRLAIERADRLRQVEVDEHFALLLDETDGVYVVDIADALHPRVVQTLPQTEPSALDVTPRRLYVGDQVQGLAIYSR